jgi:CHASE3 domain sensor protein
MSKLVANSGDARQAAARRTALVVGIVAIAIFVLSILGVWLNG